MKRKLLSSILNIAGDAFDDFKYEFAISSKTPARLLRSLSKEKSEHIIRAVATNKRTSDDILRSMIGDKNYINELISLNDNSSKETLEELSKVITKATSIYFLSQHKNIGIKALVNLSYKNVDNELLSSITNKIKEVCKRDWDLLTKEEREAATLVLFENE